MELGGRIFWGLVLALFAATAFFAVGAERRRRELSTSTVELKTGDLVTLERVVDGDSLVVRDAQGQNAPVRILGVKAFRPETDGDAASRIGREAVRTLTDRCHDQPMRLQVNAEPKDAHGRTLATVYVGSVDLGLELVKRGLALTYTAYPFPAMSLYSTEQSAARAARRGLWAEPALAARADLLDKEWQGARE